MSYKNLVQTAFNIFLVTLLFVCFLPHAKANNANLQEPSSPISVFCQPVQGNQKFFDDKPVFNTFHGRPVPLIFYIKGDQKQLHHPALVLYLPPQVKLLEAMQIGPSKPDIAYTMKHKKIIFHGKNYIRYQTTNINAKEISSSYKPRWRNFRIAIALDAPESVQSGKIYWAVENAGTEYGLAHCIVRFLKPIPVPTNQIQGQFSIMRYHNLEDTAFHSRKLQKAEADMMLASGIRGTGAFYEKNSRRGKFGQYLQSRGFNLFVGGFFQGPMNVHHWHGNPITGIPLAMGPNAKRVKKNMTAPIPTLHSKKLSHLYYKFAKERIAKSGANYVMFDYEPWGWPKKYGFGKVTLDAFARQFDIDKPLTSELILNKYRKQWTMFWVKMSNQFTKMMANACYSADSDIKTVSYTYFRNYEKKSNQWTQFKKCPKDPRQEAMVVDEVMLSAYHYNRRKLVDALRMSKRHIHHASISIIAALARQTILSKSWVRPGEDLSPQQLYQKAVLCAAMGVKRFGLYPGGAIDGAFYVALGKASRLIWAHENFYYKGKDVRKQVSVSAVTNDQLASNQNFAYTAQMAGGKVLVSLFNFTNQPMQLIVQVKNASQSTVKIPSHGVKLIEVSSSSIELSLRSPAFRDACKRRRGGG